ncbi:hypothetical protein PR202_gb02655 [Eleusine coracana subsp. coracana]|uniref:MBD domain-containing protein n=1 Tax=Eleusine coracana subsp. coracana TaxID=191504 RepID=A0AAV5DXI0_ELECO|nr:hypothetical protein PR202_gb02655 [Eleusine coracana subsp. coracana]
MKVPPLRRPNLVRNLAGHRPPGERPGRRTMRDLPVEDAVDEQAAVLEGQKAAADGSSKDSENGSDFVDGDDDLVEDDDVLFVQNVDRRVTCKRISKGFKAASTSTTKVQQVDRSLKAMESNQENPLLSPTKNFICPSPEKRQKVLSDKDAREWKPDVACDDPSEVSQDGSLIWAMDQHNIPQTPPGWERLIMIRSKGCSQFADVTWILVPAEQKYEEFYEQIEEDPFTKYYTSPAGNKLRSINEVDKYLKANLEYAAQGVKLSQFSFKILAPAKPGYVRKRTKSRNDGTKPLLTEVHLITREALATHEDPGDTSQLAPYSEDPPELLQSEPPETKKPGTPPAAV